METLNPQFLLSIEVNARAIIISIAILAAPLILVLLEKKNPRKELFLPKFNAIDSVVKALGLFALAFLALFAQGLILSALGLLDNQSVAKLITMQDALTLFLAVTIGPIGEELLFRGYLLKKIGLWPQAILFAALHYGYGSVAEVLAALTVGVLFGLFVLREKSIYAPILAHAMYNLFSIIVVLSFAGA